MLQDNSSGLFLLQGTFFLYASSSPDITVAGTGSVNQVRVGIRTAIEIVSLTVRSFGYKRKSEKDTNTMGVSTQQCTIRAYHKGDTHGGQ